MSKENFVGVSPDVYVVNSEDAVDEAYADWEQSLPNPMNGGTIECWPEHETYPAVVHFAKKETMGDITYHQIVVIPYAGIPDGIAQLAEVTE